MEAPVYVPTINNLASRDDPSNSMQTHVQVRISKICKDKWNHSLRTSFSPNAASFTCISNLPTFSVVLQERPTSRIAGVRSHVSTRQATAYWFEARNHNVNLPHKNKPLARCCTKHERSQTICSNNSGLHLDTRSDLLDLSCLS